MESIRRFADIDLELDSVPDETTICKLRHFLERHELRAKLFGRIERYLTAKGPMVREGTIVDATIMNALPSTKNRDGCRDPDMAQTRKGNEWF